MLPSSGGSASDTGRSIAIDFAGNAYITGTTFSSDYPTTPGAFQTTAVFTSSNAFVTKISPDGGSLVYSTYLGGSAEDTGFGIAIDTSDNAYVTGHTMSSDFPVTPGALRTIKPIRNEIECRWNGVDILDLPGRRPGND
ncbi:SBBP repeat-containing protein [Paenibacillus lactis]|uniref:SBBP repeat-containing protein n=1 Tax=Paenibacillus lactis TaxID=228574 RepID=UPI003D718D7E